MLVQRPDQSLDRTQFASSLEVCFRTREIRLAHRQAGSNLASPVRGLAAPGLPFGDQFLNQGCVDGLKAGRAGANLLVQHFRKLAAFGFDLLERSPEDGQVLYVLIALTREPRVNIRAAGKT